MQLATPAEPTPSTAVQVSRRATRPPQVLPQGLLLAIAALLMAVVAALCAVLVPAVRAWLQRRDEALDASFASGALERMWSHIVPGPAQPPAGPE